MPGTPDGNPVYGGPYLDNHIPDPDVPNSFVSASVGTNTVMDGNNSASGNVTAADTPQTNAAAFQAAETLNKSSVSVDPSVPGSTFTPQTDTTEKL